MANEHDPSREAGLEPEIDLDKTDRLRPPRSATGIGSGYPPGKVEKVGRAGVFHHRKGRGRFRQDYGNARGCCKNMHHASSEGAQRREHAFSFAPRQASR